MSLIKLPFIRWVIRLEVLQPYSASAVENHVSPTLRSSHYGRLNDSQKNMGLALAGIGIILVDYDADTVVPDEISGSLFGLEPGATYTRAQFHARIHPSDWPEVQGLVDRLLDPAYEDVIELTHRTLDASEAVRWVHARKQLYRDEGRGPARTAIAAVRDITAEMQNREKADLLLRELAHRTKNMVAVASAIARQTMDHSGPDRFIDDFLPRLNNLSDNLDIVSPQGRGDLRSVVDTTLARFDGAGEGKVEIDGPPVEMARGPAQTFSLMIHELMTNAVKYGAMGRPGGLVSIRWTDEGDALRFTWEETGGPPVTAPTTRGFGSRVLTRYVSMGLGVTPAIDYRPEGLRLRIDVPAATLRGDA